MTALDAMTIKMHLSELFVSTFSNETQKYQDIDKLRLIQSGLASQGTPVRTLIISQVTRAVSGFDLICHMFFTGIKI